MISSITSKIKAIDVNRPVIMAEEHTEYLASCLHAFAEYVPQVDAYGINTYYDANVSRLDSIVTRTTPNKPYLVSEFGPKGYWQKQNTQLDGYGRLIEQNFFEKAESFKHQWFAYIEKNREKNIGGVSFCWQDRFEGTATWFGITDIYGNKKPSWYSLHEIFSSKKQDDFSIPPNNIILKRLCYPNETCTAVAAANNIAVRKNLYYKWMIYKENTFEKVEETEFEKGAYSYSFIVPQEPDLYRLYLYVSDMKGNSITESKPIYIEWEQ